MSSSPLVLDAVQTARAKAVLEASAALLREVEPLAVAYAGYAAGAAGLAVVHDRLEALLPGRGHRARAVEFADRAMDLATETPHPPWVIGGTTGVAWSLNAIGALDDDDELLRALDEDLLTSLREPTLPGEWMYGVAGLTVYAEMRSFDVARALGDAIVAALERGSDDFWARMPNSTSEPSGPFVDTSLAHGVAGVIVALATCVRRGWGHGASDLLARSVARIESLPAPPGTATGYLDFSTSLAPSRVAYCRGDLTIAWALLRAADALDDAALRSGALIAAERTTNRRGPASGVTSASFCHGSAGLAFVYRQLAEATGSRTLAHASAHWFEDTMTRLGDERTLVRLDEFTGDWGVLLGLGGVAMVLATTLGGVDATWSTPLLG